MHIRVHCQDDFVKEERVIQELQVLTTSSEATIRRLAVLGLGGCGAEEAKYVYKWWTGGRK